MNLSIKTLIPHVVALALAGAALTACGGSSSAAEIGADFDDIAERAVEEGKLVVYSSATDAVNSALVDAFNAEYPEIEVAVTRLSTGDLRSRFASETTTGARSADAVIVTDPLMFNEDPEWFTELSTDRVPNVSNLRDGYAHKEHVAVVTSPWVATYNTEKISSGPIAWEDLAKPELLKDATLADPEVATDSVLSFYQLLMDEYGADYLKALGGQNDDWFDSSVPAVQKTAAGQVAIAAPGAKAHSLALVESGAPLEAVIPEPVVAFSNLTGVASEAVNPNAALLFTNFLLSTEGQAAFCGDDLYMTLVKSEVDGCSPTPDDVRIADPMRANKDREAILNAFELD
ncbi:ABC transporter substrate-binding protein [Arthrobacter sp. Marseille-P9274]|uniref:ABC transporter substrate-binding protein n=1 Tax=Arthrobacter sp. Marseille-P9274 TaxID=2866572 RepID=UPI0021CAD35F|nr:extracellular solute-binding protein [Arthrobacter sp. Marseille-P9274]